MPSPRPLASCSLLWVVATACGGQTDGVGGAQGVDPGLSMSGVAYQFQTRQPLPGARISLLELPGREAWSDADGRWSLHDLPRSAPLTPWVELDEHVPGHHQTFRLQASIDRVYLQVVPEQTYALFAGILDDAGTPVDPDACQIVTTIAEPGIAVFEDWDGFLERGDAGLLDDADASITPSVGQRLYFSEQVVPDAALERSTLDGGVLWLNVPPDGAYHLHGYHADYTFPEVEVRCGPGRFINASPPWGLTADPP